ncbi:RNB domain-containing ribonuclease [Corynebacterium mendelii]|uniref:RNB domain-containing ribonuclease n=1 Tax=Corynebacterium mendelii TaxID=2765362 RepID=A0A939IWW0_9CORY|nr:RNB domain-containing ribonuclease [Corynebacterium mendelii]MBN9643027.1 RNB domain-containing ribonuclease [Corynebacterium mendelii]
MKLYAAPLDFSPIAREMGIDRGIPDQVAAEAAAAVDRYAADRVSMTDIDFVTIDPAGSMDLDQAVDLSARPGGGFRVRYAIADVAAFVAPGGALEQFSIARGRTLYFPDYPARLHPAVLSEGEASLLPRQLRPAVVWTIDLDDRAEVVDVQVVRATVMSRARYDYTQIEKMITTGTLPEPVELLPEIGRLRAATSERAGALSLDLPDQRVVRNADGTFGLVIEPRLASMACNAEISLLTGQVAGRMMAAAGTGILRTLPPAQDTDLDEFIAFAKLMGFTPETQADDPAGLGRFLRSLGTGARDMAVMRQARTLLRGAGYTHLSADNPATPDDIHAGVGGYYAHVTAPLRRLVDRFATECCLAIAGNRPVPEWVESKLDTVAQAMDSTAAVAGRVERACLNLAEATVLAPWVGHNFTAAVLAVDTTRGSADVFVDSPPVSATCHGTPPAGSWATVTLTTADTATRRTEFAWPAD